MPRTAAQAANDIAEAAFRTYYNPILDEVAALEPIGRAVRDRASQIAHRNFPDLPPDPRTRAAAEVAAARSRRWSNLVIFTLVFGWPLILSAGPLLGGPPDQLTTWIPGALVLGVLVLLVRNLKDPPPIPGPTHDPRAAALYRRIEGPAMARAAALVADAGRHARSHIAAERAEVVNHRWTPRGPRPVARATTTARQAEFLVGDWMTFLGAERVSVSPGTRDHGVDVHAAGFVTQVKLQMSPVSPAAVQQIFGIAQSKHCTALFFTGPTGYSVASVEFARANGIALFIYDAAAGSLRGASPLAHGALNDGLPSIQNDW